MPISLEPTQCPAYHNLVAIKEDECPTYHKILDAAVGIIKDKGMEGLTVRRITAEAGVNVAAVNYHFQNKDSLLEAAYLEMTRPYTDKISSLDKKNLSPQQHLRSLLLIYGEMILSLPAALTQNFFLNTRPLSNPELILRKNRHFNTILSLMEQILGTSSQPLAVTTALQLFSALVFPLVFPPSRDILGGETPVLSLEEQVDVLFANFFAHKK